MSHFSVMVITKAYQDTDSLMLPYMENCCEQPPMEYMEFYEDEGCEVDTETGKRGYWQNPNAKWDWYVVGGRWSQNSSGALKLKDGTFSDSAYIKDIDTCPDFHTFAVVTPDGEWHEVGHMGWWGISDESDDDRNDWDANFQSMFIEPYMDCRATILDCHI